MPWTEKTETELEDERRAAEVLKEAAATRAAEAARAAEWQLFIDNERATAEERRAQRGLGPKFNPPLVPPPVAQRGWAYFDWKGEPLA